MVNTNRPATRRKRRPKPLNTKGLEDLALHYVGRFACSASRLSAYLHRKLRERGWDDDAEPDVSALVSKFTARGYVDDQSYARARRDDLLRRGYGQRRISQALGLAGIDQELAKSVEPSIYRQCEAAIRYARKRRFGPFGPETDRATREKRIAAMLRAGHNMPHIIAIFDCRSEDELQLWLEEFIDDERGQGHPWP